MKRLAYFLVLALWPLPSLAVDFSAKVVGISDGDTLTVLKADHTQVKIRLHGIDAPESGQDFGARAKQTASELAFGKPVTVKEKDTDRYGRTVAEIILSDGRSLNQEMVERGMAWWYRKYAPHNLELAGSENDAKAGKRGLWSQPGAIAPWNWRMGEGVTTGIVGNSRSHVYHKPNCPSVARMSKKNRVTFGSEAEAIKAGYRKSGDCR